MTTPVAVVRIGVLPVIVIAVSLSLMEFVRRTARPGDAILGHTKERRGYHDIARHEVIIDPRVMVSRCDAALFYGNAERFRSGCGGCWTNARMRSRCWSPLRRAERPVERCARRGIVRVETVLEDERRSPCESGI